MEWDTSSITIFVIPHYFSSASPALLVVQESKKYISVAGKSVARGKIAASGGISPVWLRMTAEMFLGREEPKQSLIESTGTYDGEANRRVC